MTSSEKQKLIEEARKGLVALAELQISQLEKQNEGYIKMYDKDKKVIPMIDTTFHNKIGEDYEALFRLNVRLSGDIEAFAKFTERYRKAKYERLKILAVYQDRKRKISDEGGYVL